MKFRRVNLLANTTKSKGQKDILDRFYTLPDVAAICIHQLDLSKYDLIVEPSAGNGSFSHQLPSCVAYDINPGAADIQKADWLALDKTFLSKGRSLVIGNPPFGEQGKKAIDFFNSCKDASTIAFVLPLSFRKSSIQNRLNLSFWLEKELDLSNTLFLFEGQKVKVPCVFQVWEKKEEQRSKKKGKTTTPYLDFVSPKEADFRIQRVGGNAGRADVDLNRAVSSNYFVKNKTNLSNLELIDIINNLVFPTISFTVGPKSLSKTELIEVLEEKLQNDFHWNEI